MVWLNSFFLTYTGATMEVLLRRRCCVGCNTEAATPPQTWATWRWMTAQKTLNFDLLYFYSMPRTCPRSSYQALITYSCLLTSFDVGSGSSVDHASAGVRAGFTYYYGEIALRDLLHNNTWLYLYGTNCWIKPLLDLSFHSLILRYRRNTW